MDTRRLREYITLARFNLIPLIVSLLFHGASLAMSLVKNSRQLSGVYVLIPQHGWDAGPLKLLVD